MLELQGISKVYEEKKVLEDINLKVRAGETLGVIGPTGSGKTTLLKIIDLLEEPTTGRMIFDGIDALNVPAFKIRRRMGMVFQETPILKGTVHDNIIYGPRLRGREPEEKEIKRVMELVELRGYENKDARGLSGGEKQRLALARALINQPELLLLDEPTSNLDPISKKRIEEAIKELKGEITIIFTTHDLIQGQHLAERIAILDNRIMQIGKPSEVFKRPSNRFVAEFVGAKNIIGGEARITRDKLTIIESDDLKIYSSKPAEGEVTAIIRPEDITVSWEPRDSSALNQLRGEVVRFEERGPLFQVQVECGDEIFTIYMTRKSFHDMKISIGSIVWIKFKASAVHIIR
ncbi:MAG: ABC transporter ATP-binding protein [Methanobacteriales archaeon]|nr:ABC transporter ATP-binding protein [Methanothermobacter sp.]